MEKSRTESNGLAIELFSCAGGMAEGFRRAGITFDLAFDKDTNACDSYAANHGHRPVQIDVNDLLRAVRCGFRPGDVRLLVADPPCTPWSLAGDRKGLEDERDCLVVTCDLIREIAPETWMIANVPGLDTMPNWPIVQRTIGALSELGYEIDYASLDAADFGVPQHRRRPFWIGSRRGRVRWPAPTHCDPSTLSLFGLKPWVSCRDALAHLHGEDLGRRVKLAWKPAKHHRPSAPDRPGRTITTNPNTDGALVAVLSFSDDRRDRHPVSRPDGPAGTITTREGRGASVLEWPWDRPSTTVTTRDTIPPPGHHPESGSILSMRDAVVLSERAAAILQGFPDGWKFCGRTKRHRWSQIGQAMPPPLAEVVARAIADMLSSDESATEKGSKTNVVT